MKKKGASAPFFVLKVKYTNPLVMILWVKDSVEGDPPTSPW